MVINTKIIILLLTASMGWGACVGAKCSEVIPTTASTASVASASLGSTSFFVAKRIDHSPNWAYGGIVNIAGFGGFGWQYNNGLMFFTSPDTISGGVSNCDVPMSLATGDVTLRLTRDTVGMKYNAEIFNTQTGTLVGKCIYTITALASNATIQAGGISVGSANAASLGGDLAFLRVCTGAPAVGTAIPVAVASPCTLGDWEFDGSTADTSGLSQNLSGVQTYNDTPSYAPQCNPGTSQAFKLGTTSATVTGSGTPLDGGLTITLLWAGVTGADGVNQSATITSPTSATTAVGHLLTFGSANFQLTCTDGSSQSTIAVVHDGVVPYDANGVVDEVAVGMSAASRQIVGPLIAYGQNPWPWADDRQLAAALLQINALANPSWYGPYWRMFATGTIAFTNGSTTVTGTGTAFKSLFCGGGTSPVNSPYLVWRYTGTDGLTHYTQDLVAGCVSDTQLTMLDRYSASDRGTAPWPNSPSGLAFREADFVSTPAMGNWEFNQSPGYYYDSGKMGRIGYWRSGIDTFWSYQDTATVYWIENPFNDYFFNCDPFAAVHFCQTGPGRGFGVTGVVLREQDGHPELLPGLRNVWLYAGFEIGLINALSIDMRDSGYFMAFEGMCALIETDPTQKATCQSTLKNTLLPTLTSIRAPGGAFQQFYADGHGTNLGSSITAIGGSGSACVTNGSASVVGTGTAWDASLVGGSFWTFNAPAGTVPADNTHGDAKMYIPIAVADATHLTLQAPYAGTTLCSRGFVANPLGIVAWGAQPFMQAHLGQALWVDADAMDGYDAPSAALFRTYAHETVTWLVTNGITPDNGGLYNGSLFPGCIPPFTYVSSDAVQMCYGTANGYNTGPVSPSQSRTLATEVMSDFAFDYVNNPTLTTKTCGDVLMAQMFNKPGTGGLAASGCNSVSDTNYLGDYDDNGTFMIGSPPLTKWANELCGYTGACAVWGGARFAGAVPSTPAPVMGGGVFGPGIK